jgi:Zn-dependent protease
VAFIVGLVVAISLHEFAHALVAYRLGDDTPKHMGRLSLSPFAHMDLLGTLFIFIAGFGWGKPVGYNPRNLKGPIDELKIALAGPATNILLAFIFALPYRIGFATGLDPNILNTAPMYVFFNVLTELNIILAVFNLLPLPPLDGSKILYLFVSDRVRTIIDRAGMPILFTILFLAYAFNLDIFGRVLSYPIFWLSYLVRIFPMNLF